MAAIFTCSKSLTESLAESGRPCMCYQKWGSIALSAKTHISDELTCHIYKLGGFILPGA
ncbi:hypothetical protein [Nitrosomonas ureae]|uniref:hypothetical protein n=1 Tax=Nitrosomonas ureae TaxID=44577 RepID=UPI0015965902|nr:hypothetical protein [Nitrosomonas ureae]